MNTPKNDQTGNVVDPEMLKLNCKILAYLKIRQSSEKHFYDYPALYYIIVLKVRINNKNAG